jgi:hypothetical protein
MTSKCLNCNSNLTGDFCSSCGQSAEVHRINSHFLWHDIQHGFLHFDKGVLYTFKELFLKPGHSIREFIEGKRVKHFKPISLVILLAGIYGFLSHYFNINILSNNFQISGTGEKVIELKNTLNNVGEWTAQHYSLLSLIQIPFFSIATYIAFRKNGYNFMEHIVLNSFLTGQRLFLRILTFPIFYFFNGTSYLRDTARVVDAIGFILFIWSLNQFFIALKFRVRVLKSIASLLIYFLFLLIILTGVSKYIFSTI